MAKNKRISSAFLKGAARVLDLGGAWPRDAAFEADRRAIGGDWVAVGRDMRRAMDKAYESSHDGTLRSQSRNGRFRERAKHPA